MILNVYVYYIVHICLYINQKTEIWYKLPTYFRLVMSSFPKENVAVTCVTDVSALGKVHTLLARLQN